MSRSIASLEQTRYGGDRNTLAHAAPEKQRMRFARGNRCASSTLWIAIACCAGCTLGMRAQPNSLPSSGPESKRGVEAVTVNASASNHLYEQSVAVTIGIDAYRELNPLAGAARDARKVATALEAQGFRVTRLLNGEATRSRISELLGRELREGLSKDSRVLIYFAGHGATVGPPDKRLGYLMPSDATKAQTVASGISMEEMQRWFALYESKHVMLIADACYSGLALNRGSEPSTRALSADAEEYLRIITSERARVSLVAGTDKQQAHEADGIGIFTDFVLSGIAGKADANKDDLVTSDELAAYVKPGVFQEVRKRFGVTQTPQSAHLGQGDFVFTHSAQSERGPCATGQECLKLARAALRMGHTSGALSRFERACQRGYGEACWELGMLNLHEPSKVEAAFKHACDAGHARGCYALGGWHLDHADSISALMALKKACDAGSPGGCVTASDMHRDGKGTAKDTEQAATLLHRACRLGGPRRSPRLSLRAGVGCQKLAIMYGESDQAEQLWKETASNFRSACESNQIPGEFRNEQDWRGVACDALSDLFLRGLGVARDHASYLRLQVRACSLHYMPACTAADRIEIHRTILRAEALRSEGRLDDAERLYRRIVRYDVTGAIHSNLAFVLLDLGRPRQALAQWDSAERYEYERYEYHGEQDRALLADMKAGQAVALETLGKHDRALRYLGVAVHNDLSYWDCRKLQRERYWSHAACAIAERLLPARRADLRRACEERRIRSCGILAQIYFWGLGVPEDQTQAKRLAIRGCRSERCKQEWSASVQAPRVQLSAARHMYRSGHLVSAERMLRGALKAGESSYDHTVAEAHNELAFVLFDQGRLKEALEEWTKALEDKWRQRAVAAAGRALALEALGHHEEAVESYQAAVKEDIIYLDCEALQSQVGWSTMACKTGKRLISAVRQVHEQACQQDSGPSCELLAAINLHGLGVLRDRAQAQQLAAKACRLEPGSCRTNYVFVDPWMSSE